MSLLLSQSLNSYANNPWYGLLTTDSFPVADCKVYNFNPVEQFKPVHMKSEIATAHRDGKDNFTKYIKRLGWHAVLGYKSSFVGGAFYHPNHGAVDRGFHKYEGVAVHVSCKK